MINLFKKWTIVRPSCFAPKEQSTLKKKLSPIYFGPKKIVPDISWPKKSPLQ